MSVELNEDTLFYFIFAYACYSPLASYKHPSHSMFSILITVVRPPLIPLFYELGVFECWFGLERNPTMGKDLYFLHGFLL